MKNGRAASYNENKDVILLSVHARNILFLACGGGLAVVTGGMCGVGVCEAE